MDIVERLRWREQSSPLTEEAAAEIERLRAELEDAKAWHGTLRVMAEKDKAEIERLNSALAVQYGMHPEGDLAKTAVAKIAQKAAEIERLRAELKEVARCHACPECRNRARHALGALAQQKRPAPANRSGQVDGGNVRETR